MRTFAGIFRLLQGKGTLAVSLPAVQGAATALLAEIPF